LSPTKRVFNLDAPEFKSKQFMPTSDNCPVTHVKELPLGTVGSAASSLTATLCQGNPDSNTSSVKCIYIRYAGAAGMLPYIN
jgi:hypothetical protein